MITSWQIDIDPRIAHDDPATHWALAVHPETRCVAALSWSDGDTWMPVGVRRGLIQWLPLTSPRCPRELDDLLHSYAASVALDAVARAWGGTAWGPDGLYGRWDSVRARNAMQDLQRIIKEDDK